MSERELIHKVRWDECPPSLNVVYAPVLSPKPLQSCRALIVCGEFVGVKTHWFEGRTTGCIGRENGCQGCLTECKTRWKGYLGVLHLADSRLWLAELTPRSYSDIAGALVEPKKLRGWHLALSRPGKSKYGQVRAAIRPPNAEERSLYLPDPFDIKQSLLLVWQRMGKISEAPAESPDEEGEVPT